MKQNKFSAAAVCGLAAVMTLQVSAAAWGATPRFGRSEEEWDRLEDNVLEYGEIEDLIHEYNVTVQNNLQQWNRDDKGKSMEDYVDWYQQSADDFYNQAAEAENEIASIGMEMQGRQAELSAQQAADAASDGETRRLSYELEEKKLAKQAQQIMNDWYQKQQTLIAQQKNRELLEAALASAQSRQSIGAATQAEVLSAQQNLQNGEAQITALKSQIEQTRQQMIVMLGWNQTSTPEIRPMPEPDQARIAAMDVAADTEKAYANDYTLKINQRKLENSVSDSSRSIYEKTIRDDRQQIAVAVNSAYQAVQQAQNSLNEAALNLEIAEKNWNTAQTQYSLGTISRMEHLQLETAYVTAQTAYETAKLTLLAAAETYDWTVRGVR